MAKYDSADAKEAGCIQRRTFFDGVFAGLAATTYGASLSKPKVGDIPRRTFGKTGERLTVIGQAGGRFPLISCEEAMTITLRAYDLGTNCCDNAPGYWGGRSEEVYGAVLPPYRKEVFITTKSPNRARQGAGGKAAALPQGFAYSLIMKAEQKCQLKGVSAEMENDVPC